MKIKITKNENNIVHGFPSSENRLVISKLSITYNQEGDSNSSGDQFLEISTENAGGGTFLVLKTERWAIDEIDELINILNDFKKRI